MSEKHEALYNILSAFCRDHIDKFASFDGLISNEEIDDLLEKFEKAQRPGEENEEAPETDDHVEPLLTPDERKDIRRRVLGSMSQVVPLMMLGPVLRRIESVLSKGAEADVLGALFFAESELEANARRPGVGDRGRRLSGYLERLKELAASFEADPGKSEDGPMQVTTTRFPPDMIKALDALAQMEGKSRSSIIHALISTALEQMEQKDEKRG